MSIFQEPFDEKIAKTLSLRQELMGKSNRTPQELTFLNSNTSWVSLKSSIDVNNDGGKLAKSNVLEGGSINNGKLRYGVGAEGAYSFQNTSGEKNELGIRPMPGITSVSIENIGAYGSTRRATVTFQCWDVKQLDILEQLYMRPGYLVFLEFGRTSYLSDGKIKQVDPDYDFFSKSDINLLEELKTLHIKSINSGGNYDGFLGYVVNYGWQARNDGGYDCKTEMISTGEVLESLKTNYTLASSFNFADLIGDNSKFSGFIMPYASKVISVDDKKRIGQDYSSNVLKGLIRDLYLAGKYITANGLNNNTSTQPHTIPVKIKGENVNVDLIKTFYKSDKDPEYNDLLGGSGLNYHISLESLIDLINKIIIPHASGKGKKDLGPLTLLSVHNRDYLGKKKESLKCLYNTLMISVDPDVCLIKNEEWIKVLSQSKISVNINPIPAVPKGYESTLNKARDGALRQKMIGWINEAASSDDHTTIMDNIHEDFKNWKAENPKKNNDDYFKYFQQIYQIVRGGINKVTVAKTESENDPKNPGTKISKPSETETITTTYRSWNYLKSYPTTLNQIKKNITPEKQDKSFITLLTHIKSGSSKAYSTPNQKFVYDELSKNFYDSTLDDNLTKDLAIAKEGVDAAKKVDETNSTLAGLGDNYKKFLDLIPKPFGTKIGDRTYGEIANIYINLKFLYKLADDPSLKSQDSSGKNSLLISQFITNMMKEIQSSIGNVNNFELHIDDKDGIGRIIDLNHVVKDNQKFEFEIGTNKSIIRDLKIESKIFSDQISMLAISAQAGSGNMGYDNSTITTYNKGVTDRLLPAKNPPNILDRTDEITNMISSLSSLVSSYLKPFIGDYFSGISTYPAASSNSFRDYLREIIMFVTAQYNTDNKQSMILPIQYSFTLDGIAGLVIGNLFSIKKDFIPKAYKESGKELGCIVMKVGHQIQNNDWTTSIEGYSFVPESKEKITNPNKFDVVIIYDPLTGTAVAGTIVSDGVVTSSTTDFNTICKAVINNLEGGYYHPDMLKDGRIKDGRYGASGETMYGLDRDKGGEMNTTPEGKAFWAKIDAIGARKNWKWGYIPPDPLKTELLDLMCKIVKIFYDRFLTTYVKDPKLIQLINSNGKLMFNFVYATWNGPGWFQKFANKVKLAYQQGTTNADQLAIVAVQARVNSGNSLITQGGNKIASLLGVKIA